MIDDNLENEELTAEDFDNWCWVWQPIEVHRYLKACSDAMLYSYYKAWLCFQDDERRMRSFMLNMRTNAAGGVGCD